MKREFSLVGVVLASALFAFGAAPVSSQERPGSSGHGSGEHAVPRGSGGGGSSASAPSGGGSSTSSSSGGSSMGSSSGGGGDHAVSRGGGARQGGREGSGASTRSGPRPRSVVLPSSPGSTAYDPGDRSAPAPRSRTGEYSRPRGDRPATGRAVPRGDMSNVPIPPSWNNDYWNSWYYAYYNPYYRYGYAPCMPYYYGCFYYDPFWWDYYYGYGYMPGVYGWGGGGGGYSGWGGGGGYASDDSDYETGGLKLKVKPRDAQVYVDGYFSGVVDDYDGVFQKLKVRAGTHRVELRAEGYEPSTFDVLVVAGDTVTYRAELKKKP